MVSFYKFTEISDPAAFAAMLTALWRPLGCRGRVYVAQEGINAQMAVPLVVMDRFTAATNSIDRLAGVYLNCDRPVVHGGLSSLDNSGSRTSSSSDSSDSSSSSSSDSTSSSSSDTDSSDAGSSDSASSDSASSSDEQELPFEALHVRVRDQIVADGLDTPLDWSSRIGTGLTPEQWHERVDAPDTVVLDCRNGYETSVGIFDTAQPLDTAFFRSVLTLPITHTA
jgi:predicted sulfurtransferase